MKTVSLILSLCALLLAGVARAQAASVPLEDLSILGGIEEGKARLVIEAVLSGAGREPGKVIVATSLDHAMAIAPVRITHTISVRFDVLQGKPRELALEIRGPGTIDAVAGDGLLDWSVRRAGEGRVLVLRPAEGTPLDRFEVQITARQPVSLVTPTQALTLAPEQTSLFNGFVKVETVSEYQVVPENTSGLVPVELSFLPERLRGEVAPEEAQPLAFRFGGSAYALPLRITTADPEARRVVLRDSRLIGDLGGEGAGFTFHATAHVRNPAGGTIVLLTGSNVALTEAGSNPDWRVRFDNGRFLLTFNKAGEFPIAVRFSAAVRQADGWNTVEFRVAPGPLQPVVLRGLPEETEFEFSGAARPERSGADFLSHLPTDGTVRLRWRESKPEAEGRLFYAAEMLSQIVIRPGLMRQMALLDGKVMQGELTRLVFHLRGAGEVTRVQGAQVLAWNVEPAEGNGERRLVVQFNQPQRDQFALQVQMQTPLGTFPQEVGAMELRPEDATRFAGYFRIVNEGAVRLEVVQSSGLSQISPDRFPESDLTRAVFSAAGNQRFAYRFSGGDFALRIRAGQISPELSVSQVIAYHLGESELAIETEIELDIREAPLRELVLGLPRNFAIARIEAPGMSDYFVRDTEEAERSELRIVYGQPVSGRQVVQLRLERNQALGGAVWTLPRIQVAGAKSTRGFAGVSADAGFRLTAERTQSLTEIATAFFPKRIAGIQAAFRLSDADWEAVMGVERLPQSVLADLFHLFSIGEGIAYGSSVMNFVVSGAPISAFQIELSGEYFNVEFTGRDIRNWQRTTEGFLVQLHTPVSGSYTLLATYERPFRPQGETLAFTGARPLDAQTEQGHTLVISAFQFQVRPVEISPGLLPLETGEVPPEYRLFFDAPILAAYRYTSRPFNLRLALSPLAQGDSLSQVVDRAGLNTRISKEGQVLTDARYFIKNRGNPHFRFTLPEGTELWSATVNGAAVVPVRDGTANLIPLPQQADPDAVLTLDLKLASRSANSERVTVAAPIIAAPVLLAEWKLGPDTGQRLVYRKGSLTPVGGLPDVSGFSQLVQTVKAGERERVVVSLVVALALLGIGLGMWRWTSRENVYRFSARHLAGTVLGLMAIVFAAVALLNVEGATRRHVESVPRDMTFVAPVQQGGSALTVEVGNLPEKPSMAGLFWHLWPALLAPVVWVYGWMRPEPVLRRAIGLLGWTLVAWAALRLPNGAPLFLAVVLLFVAVHAVIPALRQLLSAPRRPRTEPPAGTERGPAPAVIAALAGLLCLAPGVFGQAAVATQPPSRVPMAESVAQEIRVAETFALAKARIRWTAVKGQMLPALYPSAVLTRASFSAEGLRLVQAEAGGRAVRQLLALEDGVFDIEVEYQVQVERRGEESGIVLPVQHGLVNEVTLTLAGLDVDVVSPQAASVRRHSSGNDTIATLILAPSNDAWIGWKPRSRDVRLEKAVFYAELTQLYVPSAGVIDGVHHVSLRPALGELRELVFNVPSGATITDVLGSGREEAAEGQRPSGGAGAVVSLWRFDPDTRKLRVTLNPAQSRPFQVVVRSQTAAGPLPFDQTLGLLSVEGAAGEIGLLGVATGSEVQVGSVSIEGFSAINLEDYPAGIVQELAGQIPGLTVRRAFRYADSQAEFTLAALAVEPDVRVETQDTLSLGEDRTVLASTMVVTVARAGIFRLSFLMPEGFDVESISGPAMSHWTELRSDEGRVITLHMTGRTEGRQQFSINLAGPGIRSAGTWTVPQIILREAGKQQGTLLVAPEQGLRLQVASREGATQLDPQRSGIRQKGVLAFRVLQVPWSVTLDIEQVDAWVQVASLQHAVVREAQASVVANLLYQIENTGLKSLRVLLPAEAETVRFQGDQIADFLPVTGDAPAGLREWEIRLHRRVIGQYFLQALYHMAIPESAPGMVLRGVQAVEVNQQRGFVTVQAGGRLQVDAPNPPAALQPTEWQSIPRALQQDLQAVSAHLAYRLVEPAFELPLRIERHQAAKLLPARMNQITFTSVISDAGEMLTQVRLELVPGDKRLLHMTLPRGARFWFAFVNQNGVWPWREGDQILIPLEQQSRNGAPVPVEVFFTSEVGSADASSLDLELEAPKFDLPLENITWQVLLSEKWEVKDWGGTLQLQRERFVPRAPSLDLQAYLQREAVLRREKTEEAEQMLAFGNSALAQGDPHQARRAFQAAYGLSAHDYAFNEDARVQLNNLKLQQALVGLNVRQAAASGDTEVLNGRLRNLQGGKDLNYTQQDARQIIDRNTADDNAAFMRLAERLIQQQEAALPNPAAIRATIPEQGRLLVFERAVAVDPWADLRIGLKARAAGESSRGQRFAILAGTFLALGMFGWAGRAGRGVERLNA